jgi:drug/metabolite transporter (DMT)-like permease
MAKEAGTQLPVDARVHPAAPSRSVLIGSLAVLLAAACWGTSGLFVKLFLAESGITPLALAFWRDITTFVVLVTGVGLLRRSWLRVERQDLGWLAAMGASLGIFHVLWNLGVYLNGAAVATVQQAAMPAIVTVAAWLLWREPLTWAKVVAIVLTFAGTVLVSGLELLGRAEMSTAGLLVGFAIPVGYATWNMLGKKVRQRLNSFTVLTYAFGFGALVLLPFQFFTPQPWPVPPSSLKWFAALIGLSTITGFTVFMYALGRLPASVASILVMSEIAFATFYAYLFLGERLTTTQVLGAWLVVIGIAVLSLFPRRDRNAE